MKLHLLQNRYTVGYTTFGAVWDKGEVTEASFLLQGADSVEIPMQSCVAAYWPDGSIKWSRHVADARKMGAQISLLPQKQITEMDGGGIEIKEAENAYFVKTKFLSMEIPKCVHGNAAYLAKNVRKGECLAATSIYPVFQLERLTEQEKTEEKSHVSCVEGRTISEYHGEITEVTIEDRGSLQTVFCYKGNHVIGEACKMPFCTRMYIWKDMDELRFVHTYFYDGDERTDFLKGMGIRMDTRLTGENYNHHVQYVTEDMVFHETAIGLGSRSARVKSEALERQMAGEMLHFDAVSQEVAADLPKWNHYSICQDSAYHFAIKKRTKAGCCKLNCLQGKHAKGVLAATGEKGGIIAGIRDFWQKYPSGLEVEGLGENENEITIWFYSPEVPAYDFRHYDDRSYPNTCYEGFEEVGADPKGVAVTSECKVCFTDAYVGEKELMEYAEGLQKPPVYVAEPAYYHERKAFGYWSLPAKETKMECRLEEQLEQVFRFYWQEIENRDWYGLFDYGDIMHTYDGIRHTWKYDVGGFAWQNTELVPTYWLWLYFLRTGREDVFTMAEAMTRHCSEVDIYHLGKWQGLGSRHNVRHWGCSCKEPRISMAGHQRFLYYLTGDFRLGDIMDEVKDADYTMAKNPHACEKLEDGTLVPGVRSGPDWSSYVSNWMTAYERTLDRRCLGRIQTGIKDIADTPFGFVSGPDYRYDVENAHLIYKGECEDTPNQHLQICMGGLQVWLETADVLEDDTLNRLLEDLGEFYLLSPEEKARRTDGLILKRNFGWPMLASGVIAYAAMRRKDEELAGKAWKLIFSETSNWGGKDGFEVSFYNEEFRSEDKKYQEIPWLTTNMASQWCLNVIMALEFIKEYLRDSENAIL